MADGATDDVWLNSTGPSMRDYSVAALGDNQALSLVETMVEVTTDALWHSVNDHPVISEADNGEIWI